MSLTEIYFLSRTNKTLIRGATLIHGMTRALSRIPTYPRQMTSACNVAEYFVKSHKTFTTAEENQRSHPAAETSFSVTAAFAVAFTGCQACI